MNLYDELAALHKELQDALRQKDEQQAAWETKCDFIQKKLQNSQDENKILNEENTQLEQRYRKLQETDHIRIISRNW